MPQLLYPKHNYLGPGNSLFNGQPINKADEIAQAHDWDYATSKTKEEIFDSDNTAIQAFDNNLKNNFNIPSLVGKYGLSIKSGFEKLINKTVYPWNLPPKNELMSTTSKRKNTFPENTSKKQHTDPTVEERNFNHSHNIYTDEDLNPIDRNNFSELLDNSDNISNGTGGTPTEESIMDSDDIMLADPPGSGMAQKAVTKGQLALQP